MEAIEEGVCATVIDVRELVQQSSRPLKNPVLSHCWGLRGGGAHGKALLAASKSQPPPSNSPLGTEGPQ